MSSKQPRLAVISPKRTKIDRTGIYSWARYHAGFSPSFVRKLLASLDLGSNSLVFDPYLGLGTTCLEASRLGIPSIGVEINPFACVVARARVGWGFDQSEFEVALRELSEVRAQQEPPSKNFGRWFGKNESTPRFLCSLGRATQKISNRDLANFLLAAIILCLRRMAHVRKGTNPAWTAVDTDATSSPGDPYICFASQARHMLKDQMAARSSRRVNARIVNCDILKFSLNEKVDAIVTSPPYLSRLDYVMAHRLENDFLFEVGLAENADDIRTELTGGVVVIGNSPKSDWPQQSWSETSLNTLESVWNHAAKASRSYYYPLLVRYFGEMHLCLKRIRKHLRQNGVCVIVAQNSYYKDIEIPLPRIIEEMGDIAGFKETAAVYTVSVKSHLGNMDPDQRRYVPRKILTEEVILLR